MAEINRVMDQVKRQCSHAQIIMGAAVDAAMKDKLCVTVIAARQNAAPTCVSARTETHTAVARLPARREVVMARTAPKRKGRRQAGPDATAADHCFQRPVRQERADEA